MAGRYFTTFIVVFGASTVLSSGSWPPPPPKMPMPGAVLSALRKLSAGRPALPKMPASWLWPPAKMPLPKDVLAPFRKLQWHATTQPPPPRNWHHATTIQPGGVQSPCMQAFNAMSEECAPHDQEFCQPNTRCGGLWEQMNRTCTDDDRLPLGDEGEDIPAKSAIEKWYVELCSPCYSAIFTCEDDWSQICTDGSNCSVTARDALADCAANNYTYYTDSNTPRSFYQDLSEMISQCHSSAPCQAAVDYWRTQCQVADGGFRRLSHQSHCDQTTACGQAFNHALVTCSSHAGVEMPASNTDCIDDPDGLVARDPVKSCDTVGSDLWWNCDYYDPDFNGVPRWIWQLCPRTCKMCPTVAPPGPSRPTVAPPAPSHDPYMCREHQPDHWDVDCCGYSYETWCADGYIKAQSFVGGEHDCWPGRKGYRCYPPSMDVMNAVELMNYKAECQAPEAPRPQPRCATISKEKADRIKAIECKPPTTTMWPPP